MPLSALPIINKHVIYVGESSSDKATSSIHKRLSEFRGTCRNPFKDDAHAGALGFMGELKNRLAYYADESKCYHAEEIVKTCLYYRYAEMDESWLAKPVRHESYILGVYEHLYPGQLFNTK